MGIAKLAEHFRGVLGKFRRGAAQAGFGSFQPDRRGDTLVPVPLYDVAAVDRVRVGQRLVDLLHRTCRQAGGEQAVAERLGFMLAEDGGKLGSQGIVVGDAVLVAGKARVGAEIGLADLLAQSVLVGKIA